MTLRLTLAALALLSQTGCVAAIPMAMQMVSGGAGMSSQLCSMVRMSGPAASLCEHMPFAMAGKVPVEPAQPTSQKVPNAGRMDTAAR